MEINTTDQRGRILADILQERERQRAKWGDEIPRDNFLWTTILTEEVGEVARAAHDITFADATIDNLREELIQVAAVAVRWLESLDKL